MINYTGTYTDQYELTMAQVYFQKGRENEKAVFDYFFRKLPFHSGYAVFAGLEDLLDALENLRFDDKDLRYLSEIGFPADFVEYLKDFQFKGDIFSSREGDLVFPNRPVLRVEANLIEAQLIETLLLNILNFQTLIATKASRMRMVAGNRKLIDFGLRRAQGSGGYSASRATVIGGFDATSNVRASRDYDIPALGTMAHSFIQSYDDELSAFRDFAENRPDDCVLLVDTYNTLKSGIPNAIIVAKELEKRGYSLKAIRLDSGDLAYLAQQSRKMLDQAGLPNVKIAVSNQLDEYVIKSLLEQEAPIDIFGVGTSLVTGAPDAALDGVYKLVLLDGKPRIKLSENLGKVTLPNKKQVYRIFDSNGNWIGADAIALEDETDFSKITHPFDVLKSLSVKNCVKEPLLVKVMENGKRMEKPRTLEEIASFSSGRLKSLSPEFKRFNNPHIYKVGISDKLMKERDILIETLKKD
ncbi:MAG: nicotinate phosphoribosyltransferase [Bacteroidota bacterium]|nr:nicotinate phosphoribosyltransferase [Bacteroidota bacterium]